MKRTKRLCRLVRAGIILCVALLLLTGVAIGLGYPLEEQKKSASEQCQQIAVVVAYHNWPLGSEHPAPPTRVVLVHPVGGGPAFLRDGDAELLDPWGKPYRMESVRQSDGTVIILITTSAPDGTPISQFGIGRNAQLRRE